MEDILQTDKQSYALRVLQRFDDFQQKGQHCDFTVKAGLDEIPAHRNVLAAGSDYFNAMLSHDTLENQSGVVEIKEADAESVKKCIDFMYNRDVAITADKCADLMQVAHMFQLHDFFSVIVTYFGDRLNAKCFFEAKRLAGIYELDTLSENCDRFALNNLAEISEDDKFMEIDEKYLSFLVESEETIATEDLKCFVTLRWIKFDLANREGLLLDLMKKLKLSETDLGYRRHLTEREPLVQRDKECLGIVTASVFQSVGVNARNYSTTPSCVIVFDKNSGSVQKSAFNGKWMHVRSMTPEMKRSRFSAIVLHKWIYILMKGRKVQRLNYKDAGATWNPVESMLEEHGQSPPATVSGSCIYVAGACSNRKTNIISAEKYELSAGKWVNLPNKRIKCVSASLVALNGCVYSVGGFDANALKEVECFNEKTTVWSSVASMQYGRHNPGVCAFRERVYAVGGYGVNVVPSSVCEYYSPADDTWTEIASLNVPRGLFKVFATDLNIYAVGGRDGPAKNIEKFDLEKNEWKVVVDMAHMDIERAASVAV